MYKNGRITFYLDNWHSPSFDVEAMSKTHAYDLTVGYLTYEQQQQISSYKVVWHEEVIESSTDSESNYDNTSNDSGSGRNYSGSSSEGESVIGYLIFNFLISYPSFIIIAIAGFQLGNYDFPFDWVLRLVIGGIFGFGSYYLMGFVHSFFFDGGNWKNYLGYFIEVPILGALPIYLGARFYGTCYLDWGWPLFISALLPIIICGFWVFGTYIKIFDDFKISSSGFRLGFLILTIVLFMVASFVATTLWDKKYVGLRENYSQINNTESHMPVTYDYVSTANVLNVRSRPSTNGARIGRINKGDIIKVFEISGKWAKIEFQGNNAYVSVNWIIPKDNK